MVGRPALAAKDEAGWYFVLVGALAIAVYVISKPLGEFVPRYLLLAVFLPMGVVALAFSQGHVVLRSVAIAVVAVFVASSAADHLLQAYRYAGGRERNETRELANVLEARGIQLAESTYWLAYKVSYLTEERVKLASRDVVRVQEYQELVRAATAPVPRIGSEPCEGGERVVAWYLCAPGH